MIYYASIPRLADDYVRSRKDMFSSGASNLVNQKAGVYVLSKAYFRTAADIKASPNVIPDHAEPVTFKDGDKIIELRTVFLLIPAETSPASLTPRNSRCGGRQRHGRHPSEAAMNSSNSAPPPQSGNIRKSRISRIH